AWAISPPIVPAPTTAALKTNIRLRSGLVFRAGGARRRLWSVVDLALDEAHRADHRIKEGLELGHQPVVLAPAGLGDRVEAAGAPVGVLPAPLDQLPGLEIAQHRVDRVRVDRDHALRDALDLL